MADFVAFLVALVLASFHALTGGSGVAIDPVVQAPVVENATTSQEYAEIVATVTKPSTPEPIVRTPEVPAPLPAVQTVQPTLSVSEITVMEEDSLPRKDYATRLEEEVFKQSNIERVKNGLKPLAEDSALSNIARAHSKDMYENNYFSHDDEDECNSACRAKDAEYAYRSIGENLFMTKGHQLDEEDMAALIVQGWLGSPGHRANLLRETYTHMGVGIHVGGKSIYTTSLYSLPR